MKYIVMAALLMAGVATRAQEPLRAQAVKSPVERLTPAQRTEKLTASLGLTQEQQAKVKDAYEEQEKNTGDLKEKYKGQKDEASRREWMRGIVANRDQFKAKMKDILTPEQYTKWQSVKERPVSKGTKAGAKDDSRLEQHPSGN